MSTHGSSKRSRIRSMGIVVALAVSVSLVAPDGTRAADLYNVGGGVVHGTATFLGEGLAAAGETCIPNISFDVDALAPGAAYNTVTTGFVGDLEITGNGVSECGNATESGGTLSLSVTGTGPTGSEIVCNSLTGGFLRNATVVRVDLSGSCTVNDYGTARIQFLSVLDFTPFEPTGAGVNGTNIKKAFFDGTFVLVPAAS